MKRIASKNGSIENFIEISRINELLNPLEYIPDLKKDEATNDDVYNGIWYWKANWEEF